MRNAKVRRGAMTRRSRPEFEGLESRQLLSAVVVNDHPMANSLASQGAISSSVFENLSADTPGFTSPLAGRTVYLDLKGDGKLDPGDPTALTAANGQYVFNNLSPGSYTVRLQTYPGENLIGPAGTSQSVTVTAGGTAAPASFGVLPGSSILPLTTTANPFGTNSPDLATAEVNGLYNTILGRAPDVSGGSAADAYLSGGGSLQTLASDLFGSIEYDSNLVASYYTNFLGRAGTSAEINAWVSLMQGGLLEKDLAADFFNSTEYSQLHASDSGFIQSLYNNILGRQGATSEVSFWEGFIAGGGTRAKVVQGFLGSVEAATRAVEGFDGIFDGRPQLNAFDDITESGSIYSGIPQLYYAIVHASSNDFAGRAGLAVKGPMLV
jgi:hypothetical protein